MKNFLKNWLVITLMFVCLIAVIIYSIKWAMIAYSQPDIGYWEMRKYPYTHFSEYWPAFVWVILFCILFFAGDEIQNTISNYIKTYEKKQKNHR